MSEPLVRADGAVGKALAFMLKSTAARPQTEAELRAKLRGRDVPDEIADEALIKAKALGAVDDLAFARAWVEDRGRSRGFGVARLRDELRRRQVPDDLVEQALAGLDDRDELSAALELGRARAQRMPASLPPETVARRVAGFLARRGYPPGICQKVARQVTATDRDWD